MDAEEGVGVELRFDGVHRLAEEVGVGADVQLDVVAGGFDPVDFVGADEEDAAAGLDDEAFEPLCVRLEILDQLEEAPLEIAVRLALELLPGPYERFVEALDGRTASAGSRARGRRTRASA